MPLVEDSRQTPDRRFVKRRTNALGARAIPTERGNLHDEATRTGSLRAATIHGARQ
jgi:hypothetical protein